MNFVEQGLQKYKEKGTLINIKTKEGLQIIKARILELGENNVVLQEFDVEYGTPGAVKQVAKGDIFSIEEFKSQSCSCLLLDF